MNKYNLRVGQMVYVSANILPSDWYEVEKVGRKYFYLKHHRGKFDLETLEESDYVGRPDIVYLSEEDYNNHQLKARLSLYFRNFRWNELSLEKLKMIDEIIKS